MTKPQAICDTHNVQGCLACKNRSYAEQLPTCQCVIPPHGASSCIKTARYSVIRDKQRIYVCSGCTLPEDKDRIDLLTPDMDVKVEDWA